MALRMIRLVSLCPKMAVLAIFSQRFLSETSQKPTLFDSDFLSSIVRPKSTAYFGHELVVSLAAAVVLLTGCGDTSSAVAPKGIPSAIPTPVEVVEIKLTDERKINQRVVESAPVSLAPYVKTHGISGNLSSIGSDTLANLMTLWTESFSRHYPSVNIQVQAAGSSTAPPALTEGTANFGPMSRAMKDKEIEAFETRHGYRPTAIRVAIDALAVYVHKDNPLDSLSIEQVDAAFSTTRRCAGNRSLDVWGDLGLTGSWQKRPVQLYGRNSVSGTYGYFKKIALCSGDFKNRVNEQPGSASVVQAVASSLNGIGYSGIGYMTSSVKALAISDKNSAAIAATPATALSGEYPLARYLYVYVNKQPSQALSPIEIEFLRLLLSKDGQQVVTKDGYVALSAQTAAAELAKVQ